MEKPRVLLVCSQHLFGESLETILRAANDIDLSGPWAMDVDIHKEILHLSPTVVVIADENPNSEPASHLTSSIIEQYPDLPVIRAGLIENTFRVFSTHTLPARGPNLLDAIRHLPLGEHGSDSVTKKVTKRSRL